MNRITRKLIKVFFKKNKILSLKTNWSILSILKKCVKTNKTLTLKIIQKLLDKFLILKLKIYTIFHALMINVVKKLFKIKRLKNIDVIHAKLSLNK